MNRSDVIYYCVNGILAGHEDPNNWASQAQAFFHESGYEAEGYTYSDGIVGASLALDRRALEVAENIRANAIDGFSTRYVGHSNACRIFCHAFHASSDFRCDEGHLFAAAITEDCEQNFLNMASRQGRLGRLFLYVSPDDEILGAGALISYGRLGKDGPRNVCPELARIMTVVQPFNRPCRHCDWVSRDFDLSMASVLRNGGGN